MHTSFLLFFEFVKIGLFTYGGGYASLPFLYELVEKYSWFTHEQLTQLIAISGITPGPIGLNMATFSGFNTLGFFGAILSSFGLILPMILITTQVFRLYRKFCESKLVKSILYFLRPTSCALITGVGLKLFYNLVLCDFNFEALFVVLFLFALTFKLKRDPIIYMAIAGVLGIGFYIFEAWQ